MSTDGATVAMLDGGAGVVQVLDLDTWELLEVSVCEGIGGVTPDPMTDAGFYVGCADGSLAWFEVDDGAVNDGGEAVALAETDIIGLTSNDSLVFALAEHPSGGNPQVYAYSAESEVTLTDGFPSTLGYSSVKDMEASASFVFFSHGVACFL